MVICNFKYVGEQPHSDRFADAVLNLCRKKGTAGTTKGDACLIELLLSSTADTTSAGSDAAATAQTAGGSKLTDQEIIDNIKIFLFAGHDSTASTLLWVLYLLAVHPHYIERIRAETSSIDVNSVTGSELYDLLKTRLPFVQNFLKETLRLYPPAWAINRSPKKDLQLNGYSVPKGTSIMINTLRLHRRGEGGRVQQC
jgi:cytochrome P450